jgi:hypothetical protein
VLKVADTAANLRSTTGGTTRWVAALQGLGAANDAGGGTFYWSTTPAADDGWSVLNNGSGNSAGWRRIRSDSLPEGWFSVKDPRFGAKGTGSVDDTVAIQAHSEEQIERDAAALLTEYAQVRGIKITPPIPIEDIVEKHLKLGIEFDDLHDVWRAA